MPVDLFSTHYRIDSSRVLRQSLCGKFEFSAEFSSKLSQFFGCMGGTLANRKGNDVDQGIGISSLGTSSTQVWWSLARLNVLKLTDRGAVADYWQAGDWMTTDANHHLRTIRHELGTRCLKKLWAAEMDHWHCGGLCMLLVFT